MNEDETFFKFLIRTIQTFWAYVLLTVMFLLTGVIMAQVVVSIYKELNNQEIILKTRPI